jgi:hypothetical protein
MSTEFSFALKTALKPTKKFTVDGEPYDMLGVDHLSTDEEAETVALFARYGVLQAELEMEKNTSKGKAIALQMKATRITLLSKLTTVPKDVAALLPLTQQVKLLEAIQSEVEADDDDETPEPVQEDGAAG